MSNDVTTELQDLTHLDWSESATTSAAGGSYLKARSGDGAEATYYKLSCYDEVNGIYGHECVNETIAARLMDALFVEHVPYQLVHARVLIAGRERETWLSESASFRKRGESKVSLARLFGQNRLESETRLQFCNRFGWTRDIQKMMLVDFLIGNRDRHGANLEVLKGRDGRLRLAPLFDNGLSLCYSSFNADQLGGVDPLQDIVTNNYLGTRSLEQNLRRFVPSDLPIGRLGEEHKVQVIGGLAPALEGAIQGMSGVAFAECLWQMIWKRWCLYEDLRDSGLLEAQG